jgi:hypothetical protein
MGRRVVSNATKFPGTPVGCAGEAFTNVTVAPPFVNRPLNRHYLAWIPTRLFVAGAL